MSITNSIEFEVYEYSVIPFLNARKIRPAKIHHQLVKVYGEGVMMKGMCVSGVVYLMGERQMCAMKPTH
jgi:serine kinase of HPr protein (carbohydrate metabolism regulator)